MSRFSKFRLSDLLLNRYQVLTIAGLAVSILPAYPVLLLLYYLKHGYSPNFYAGGFIDGIFVTFLIVYPLIYGFVKSVLGFSKNLHLFVFVFIVYSAFFIVISLFLEVLDQDVLSFLYVFLSIILVSVLHLLLHYLIDRFVVDL